MRGNHNQQVTCKAVQHQGDSRTNTATVSRCGSRKNLELDLSHHTRRRSHPVAFPRGSVVALCCPTRRPLCSAEVLAPSATKTFSVSVQPPMRRRPEQYSRQHAKVISLSISFAVCQCRAVFQMSAPRAQRVVATTQQIVGMKIQWL